MFALVALVGVLCAFARECFSTFRGRKVTHSPVTSRHSPIPGSFRGARGLRSVHAATGLLPPAPKGPRVRGTHGTRRHSDRHRGALPPQQSPHHLHTRASAL